MSDWSLYKVIDQYYIKFQILRWMHKKMQLQKKRHESWSNWHFIDIFLFIIFFRNGEMSLTLELLRMETDREPLFWPFNAGNGLISAVPHDCPKAKKASNTTADPALVNNNNNNNNASTKVLNGLSQHKRHSYCKYTLWVVKTNYHISYFIYH